MDSKKQTLAQHRDQFKEEGNFIRKLVVATNVAESSLTIDGIKYVIDSGYELSSSYDPNKRAKKLDRQMISNAQAKQRMGRAGRTEPGICYHFYTKNDFENEMKKFPQPDIRVSDLSGPSLKLMSLDAITDVKHLLKIYSEFIEPPMENYIRTGINQLVQLGAIELNGITKLGKLMANINLDPMPALFVIMGKIYNCAYELINLVAMLDAIKMNMNSLFTSPKYLLKGKENDKQKYNKMLKQLEDKFNKEKSKFKHKYGDHISLINLFDTFNEMYEKNADNWQNQKEWANKRFIKLGALIKAKKYSQKLRRSLWRNIPKDFNASDIDIDFNPQILKMPVEDRVMICLLIGYQLNKAVKKNKNSYKTKYEHNIQIDKNSFLQLNKTLPTNVIYSELFISMGRSELNIVSRIPSTLLDMLD